MNVDAFAAGPVANCFVDVVVPSPVIPASFKFNLFNTLPKSGKLDLAQKVISAAVAITTSYFGSDRCRLHYENSSEEGFQGVVAELGLSLSNVPETVGGSWQ